MAAMFKRNGEANEQKEEEVKMRIWIPFDAHDERRLLDRPTRACQWIPLLHFSVSHCYSHSTSQLPIPTQSTMNRSRAGTPGSTISRGVSPSNTNNDDIFDTSTFRNANKKASKRKADDASSRAGGSNTTKRKRKPDQGSGRASRPASVFSGRQGSVKGKATGGRSYAGSVVDGDDGGSSRGFPEDNRDEEEDEEDEDDEEEEVVGADVDEWNLKTPITPEQEAIAARYQETRVHLER